VAYGHYFAVSWCYWGPGTKGIYELEPSCELEEDVKIALDEAVVAAYA
jgi:hypothetical protein